MTVSHKKFYAKLYRLRVVEQKRFVVGGAKYAEDLKRLAERVAKFLPRVNANYTIIDTKEHELKGISPEFRGTISHLVMHGVNNRVDAYMELFLRHPLSIRRYYRQFDY